MSRVYYEDFPVLPTVKDLILDGFDRGGEKRQFLFHDAAGKEREKRFCDVKADTLALGAYLRKKGLVPGERIAIAMGNCYEWNAAFYALAVGGWTAVPLDANLPAEELADELRRGGCAAVFHDEARREKIEAARGAGLPALRLAFDMARAGEYYAEGAAAADEETALLNVPAAPEDLLAIVYTSGTTGPAKGVMLTHKNVCADVYALLHISTGGHGIGFLPLNHTYSWVTGLFATLVKSEWGYICTDLRKLYRDISAYKPYQFAAVPLAVEMIYQNILHTARRNGAEEKLRRAIETSRNFMLSGYDARREMFADIHEKLGGNLETVFCGGAHLDPGIEEFMFDIGIQVRTGYGLTECAPVVACQRQWEYKFGSVGLPLECCEVRIHEPDAHGIGEIRVRGDNVSPGYYGDPAATAEAFEDGWFKTGDLGYLDEEGYLFFTGRKKNLIVLSNGENVSPEQLETRLAARIPYIKEALVRERDGRLTAELYPDPEEAPDAKDRIAEDLKAFNADLPAYLRLANVTLRDTPFEKTATMKIKRS